MSEGKDPDYEWLYKEGSPGGVRDPDADRTPVSMGDTGPILRVPEHHVDSRRKRGGLLGLYAKGVGAAAAFLAAAAGLSTGIHATSSRETSPSSGKPVITAPQYPSSSPEQPSPGKPDRRGVVESGSTENKVVLDEADTILRMLGGTVLAHPLDPHLKKLEVEEIVQGGKVDGGELKLFLEGNPNMDENNPDISLELTKKDGQTEGELSFYLDRNGDLNTAKAAAENSPMAPSLLIGLFRQNGIAWVLQPDGSVVGSGAFQLPDSIDSQFTATIKPDGQVIFIGDFSLASKFLKGNPVGS